MFKDIPEDDMQEPLQKAEGAGELVDLTWSSASAATQFTATHLALQRWPIF